MKSDATPSQTAKSLLEEHGKDRALKVVSDGIVDAHKKSDNYALSVWREVKAILRSVDAHKRLQAENLQPAIWKCLMCSTSFQSMDIGEPVCPVCKNTRTWRQD